jgi:retron-type reverse transcriptase
MKEVRANVRAFFDSIDWELLLKAVRQHTDCPWVLLSVIPSTPRNTHVRQKKEIKSQDLKSSRLQAW